MAVRIVLADDDQRFCEVIEAFIRMEPGFELCAAARDGLEALAMVRERSPDVLLLDLVMPRLDGLGVLERLSRQGGLKVIVLTRLCQREHHGVGAQNGGG